MSACHINQKAASKPSVPRTRGCDNRPDNPETAAVRIPELRTYPRFGPKRSATHPTTGTTTPMAKAWAVTHWIRADKTPNSPMRTWQC